MIVNPTSFTYEYLSSLKFKELQKLSVQFHVNKRWAKKQELVENLLALRDEAHSRDSTNDKEEEDKEWRDGSIVFRDLKTNDNNSDVDRRLTFNIDKKSDSDPIDPRLTFEVTQNGKHLISKDDEVNESRKTYEIPPQKAVFGMIDPRATFDIPQNGKLLPDKIDPRATFDVPQNNLNNKLLEDINRVSNKSKRSGGSNSGRKGHKAKVDLTTERLQVSLIGSSGFKQEPEKKLPFDITVKNEENKNNKIIQSQVKMLTIPYARVSKRNKKNGEGSKNDETPIKMSKKSVNIKKSSRLPVGKIDLLKSPASVKKPLRNKTVVQPLTIPQDRRIFQSKIPKKPQLKEEKSVNMAESDKENLSRILRKRISKAVDENHSKKPNSVKVSFMSPPPSLSKNHRALLPLRKTPMNKGNEIKCTFGKLNSSVTPKAKPTVTAKPITSTKMPDFSKIHQKQFEQMDSLHDYLRKKEERTRKLFGTPQPEALNKSLGLFRFEFSANGKSVPNYGKSTGNFATPLKKKEENLKSAQREAVKNKLPPKCQTDIKDKNRSHIHGVRTNKRFELQMKFRNM